jgi:hypothetical protein
MKEEEDEQQPQMILHRKKGRLVDEDGFEYTDWEE